MKISSLFEDKSDLYAAARPMYPDVLFEYAASLVDMHQTAWDCACGNGQAAVDLARYFDHVEATDISQNQIANGFADKKIRYSVQPAETTTFQDNQFDLVNVALALHWFDLDKFWREVHRVLKPNGVFIAYTYAWFQVTQEIDEAIDKYIRSVIAPYWAPNNKLCWDNYQTIEFPFEKLDTPAFELKMKWNFEQYMNYMHTWSATRRCMDALGTTFFEQAKQAVLKVWGGPADKKLIKSPLTVIAGYRW